MNPYTAYKTLKQALLDAVNKFEEAKAPLWNLQKESADHMRIAITRRYQTLFQLRDGVLSACEAINGNLVGKMCSGLLIDLIKAVFQRPDLKLEYLYEKILQDQTNVIDKQEDLIAQRDVSVSKLRSERLEKFENCPIYTEMVDELLVEKKRSEEVVKINAKLQDENSVLKKSLSYYQLNVEEILKTVQTLSLDLQRTTDDYVMMRLDLNDTKRQLQAADIKIRKLELDNGQLHAELSGQDNMGAQNSYRLQQVGAP